MRVYFALLFICVTVVIQQTHCEEKNAEPASFPGIICKSGESNCIQFCRSYPLCHQDGKCVYFSNRCVCYGPRLYSHDGVSCLNY